MNSAKLYYRPDIDGLRAIAVLAVMFFYLNHSFISGGYVGVDVLCKGQDCLLEYEHKSLYRNDDHLSVFGAHKLANSLSETLKPEK